MFERLQNSLVSLFSPQECKVCGRHVENLGDGVACSACWSETRIFDGSQTLCSKCGAFFRDSRGSGEFRCHACDEHAYDKAAAVGVYEKALAATIIKLKSDPQIPARAAEAFFRAFQDSPFGSTTLILPIPLSSRRLIERGYNQADLLGDDLARRTGIRIDKLSLRRKVHTPLHRVAMDMKARELTVKNAFVVERPKLIAGQNILLVDDVFTSGSTSSNCAKVLKKNGAAEVNVLTLARAISN